MPGIDAAARAWTGLGADLSPVEVAVIGRGAWVDANLRIVAGVLEPLADRLPERPPGAARAMGAQIGGLLGLLSTRVLGQYLLPLDRPGPGRLVVVGPNVLDTADRLGGTADDLRRTILLHEVAHRLQFEGVDWLGDHLRGVLRRYLDDTRMDSGTLLAVLPRLPGAVVEALRQGSVEPLVRALMAPGQRAALDEAQAVMSLLEGHGNATMGLAADGVVDDPQGVSRALERRRSRRGGRIVAAATGMQAKARQYREGEAFVRTVVGRVGVDGLNAAWAAPDRLPDLAELRDPDRWVARVHG